MKKVRINNGRAVHMAKVGTDRNGKTTYTVSCGTARIQNASAPRYRVAASNEEVTCKKCLAAMEKEMQEQQQESPAEEMSLKEYVQKFGFTVTAEEMKPSKSAAGQNKKLTTAQKRKYGII